MRYLVKKYQWINLNDLTLAFFVDDTLTLSVQFHRFVDKKLFEGADDSDTNIFFELKTSKNFQFIPVMGTFVEQNGE